MLTSGCRRRGFWKALAKAGWAGDAAALDRTYVRAHRSAHGGKGGAKARAIGPLTLSLSKDVVLKRRWVVGADPWRDEPLGRPAP